MKRLLTLLVITLTMTVSTSAQLPIKFGVTGGLNIPHLHVANSEYKEYVNKAKPGYLIGPTAIVAIPRTPLSVDVSALFDYRGAKSKDTGLKTSVTNHSFQFPINIRYGFELGDMVYAFAFAGPQFGINTSEKEQFIISGTGKNSGHALERRWISNGTTTSINFGVGGLVLDKVQVRISYNFELTETGYINQVDLVDGSSKRLTGGKTHSCQIALSYLF